MMVERDPSSDGGAQEQEQRPQAPSVVAGNVYDKYGTDNPIARRLVAAYVARLRALLHSGAGGSLLEVGCGEGELLRLVLDELDFEPVVASDIDHGIMATVPVAAARVQARIETLPFPDRQFDVVLAAQVLEHAVDPEAGLAELARVSKNLVLVSVPREPLWRILNLARLKYVTDLGNTPGHVQHWSSAAFVEFCSRHLDIIGIGTPLPWTMVLGRPLTRSTS